MRSRQTLIDELIEYNDHMYTGEVREARFHKLVISALIELLESK